MKLVSDIPANQILKSHIVQSSNESGIILLIGFSRLESRRTVPGSNRRVETSCCPGGVGTEATHHMIYSFIHNVCINMPPLYELYRYLGLVPLLRPQFFSELVHLRSFMRVSVPPTLNAHNGYFDLI